MPLFKKSIKFNYSYADHKFSQGAQVELQVVTAKHGLFDLFAFFSIMTYLLLLNYACTFVGVRSSEKSDKRE